MHKSNKSNVFDGFQLPAGLSERWSAGHDRPAGSWKPPKTLDLLDLGILFDLIDFIGFDWIYARFLKFLLKTIVFLWFSYAFMKRYWFSLGFLMFSCKSISFTLVFFGFPFKIQLN